MIISNKLTKKTKKITKDFFDLAKKQITEQIIFGIIYHFDGVSKFYYDINLR